MHRTRRSFSILIIKILKIQVYESILTSVSRSDASKSLKKKFGALHGLSSLINLGALVAGVSHLVWLAGKMLI